MNDRSYEEDSRIDENCDLALEWERQAERMMYWSRKHALAITKTNRARESLRIIKGEVKREIDRERAKFDLDVRRFPADYGLKNPSEAAISHAINRDDEFMEFCDDQERRVNEANEALILAIEEENVYEGAVKAMTHKKRALEELQSLWEKNWFGEPDSRNARLADARRTTENLRKGLRERGRSYHG